MPNLNYGKDDFDIGDVKNDVNVDVNLWSEIKESIRHNPKVTQRQLVNKLGVSFRKIQKNMTEMVDCGEIIRIGSTRGGHWEVLK